MEDLTFTQTRPKVTIQITSEDGVAHDHSFEVLPLTKPRYEEVLAFAKRGKKLEESDDVEGMAPALAELCDKLVRSTNGPVTITSLWDDGVLPFAWVMRLAQHLQEGVSDPPA